MPGSNGTIIIRGSTKNAYKAKVANVELAEAALASAELAKIRKQIGPSEVELPQKRDLSRLPASKANQEIPDPPRRPHKMVSIGGDLSKDLEAELPTFLRANWNIFAWKPPNMLGVPAEKAEHCPNVHKDARPVKKALKRFTTKK